MWVGWGRRWPQAGLRQVAGKVSFPAGARLRVFVAGLSFVLFYVGRVVHTRWGDAYLLVNGIALPDVRLLYNWQAPLDTFVHALLFRLGERLWGWTNAMPAYWWLSSLAGAFAVWVLLRLAHDVGSTRLQRWAVLGGMTTLGAMQLFFGYPENYTIISVLILLYLWLGWQFSQGQASLWAPSIVLALAHGFHPATLVLATLAVVVRTIGDKRQREEATRAEVRTHPTGVVSAAAGGGFGLCWR